MAKVAPQMKANLTTKVPSPKMQGGHSSSEAVTQKTKIQTKAGASKPGKTEIKYSVQPSATRGTNPGAK
jgi:hypothetical protein